MGKYLVVKIRSIIEMVLKRIYIEKCINERVESKGNEEMEQRKSDSKRKVSNSPYNNITAINEHLAKCRKEDI